jgi:hypothetical protein
MGGNGGRIGKARVKLKSMPISGSVGSEKLGIGGIGMGGSGGSTGSARVRLKSIPMSGSVGRLNDGIGGIGIGGSGGRSGSASVGNEQRLKSQEMVPVPVSGMSTGDDGA